MRRIPADKLDHPSEARKDLRNSPAVSLATAFPIPLQQKSHINDILLTHVGLILKIGGESKG